MTVFLNVANNAETTLNGAILIGALSMVVTADVFPAVPFHVTLENEIIKVTNKDVLTFTIERSQEGTAAAGHADGTTIRLNTTAKPTTDLNTAVNALEGGIAGNLDNTPGGTDGLLTKAPTSNVMYDHDVATTGIHGVGASTVESIAGSQSKVDTHAALTAPHSATAAATVDRLMLRDAAGRAAVVAPSVAGDIAIKSTVDDHAALTTAHSAVEAATAHRIVLRDAAGRACMGAPALSSQIAIKSTVTDHAALTTDTHGVGAGAIVANPLLAALDFAKYKAIRLVCDNGATMPTTPVAGQWFYHAPTGRKILYQYNGSAWIPIMSFGSMTVYVDKTDGTDDLNHGTAVDANAFATVQYAVNSIPGLVGGDVVININNETYNESVIIRGKSFSANYSISIYGVLALQETAAAATVAAGTGATQGTVTKTGAFTGDVYANMLAYFVTDDIYRLIDSHTDDVLTLVGTASSSTAQDVAVYGWGTQISGSTSISVLNGQQGVNIIDIYLNGSSYGARLSDICAAGFIRCKLPKSFILRNASFLDASYCYMQAQINQYYLCHAGLTGSKIESATSCWELSTVGTGRLMNGSILVGGTYGAFLAGNVVLNCYNAAGVGYARIRNCSTAGILAKEGAMGIQTSTIVYSGNGANESATAASYGYID